MFFEERINTKGSPHYPTMHWPINSWIVINEV